MRKDSLKFSDGVTFNTTTSNYYLIRKYDGWYVAGKGLLCPVASCKEGREYIRELIDMERLREMAKGNSGTD